MVIAIVLVIAGSVVRVAACIRGDMPRFNSLAGSISARAGSALPALAVYATARIQSGLFHAIENRFDQRIQEHKRRKYKC